VIDRLSPALRPAGRNAGRQTWEDLLFVHWPVPVEALRPLVPARLSLDLLDGVAWVGVVPFAMRDIRTPLHPKGTGLNFLEANVRTYVHLDGDRPGVFFLSLEASSRLAVRVARWRWSLPYHHATMAMSRGDAVEFSSRRRSDGSSLSASWRTGDLLGPSEPGTADHFLLERYLLYAEHQGTLHVGQVHHPPYVRQAVRDVVVTESLLAAAGLPPTDGPPPLAHSSPGVDVEVFALRPV
jgi:uncharacterized protein